MELSTSDTTARLTTAEDEDNLAKRVAIRQFRTYPFDEDTVFQQGLKSILSDEAMHEKSSEEIGSLVLHSKLFYFDRITQITLTPEDLAQFPEDATAGPPPVTLKPLTEGENASTPNAEERVLSFAELAALIQQGKTDQIPNNKHIPNIINSESSSISNAVPRKKPWEQNSHGTSS